MAKEPKKVTGEVDATVSTITVADSEIKKTKKKKKGLFSKIWNALFRSQGDDFEKRLQHITKEEAAILSRMRRRSQSWRRMMRNFVILSVLLEVMAVGYAIMTTRTLELDWKMRAVRVLPMFLLPGLSFLTYSAANSFSRMLDRKDQKTVERLRAERQAKIDELKEKTNYYITQQLIQRYDPDPAAKAAAATVLASKLGSDSGLKVYVGDEPKPTLLGKSSDVELVPSGGLRNRKQVQTRGSSTDSTVLHPHEEEMLHQTAPEELDISSRQQLVVEHHQQTGSSTEGGGWLARFAALLVGEDPTQSYALICGNCHMHNGLARKEDFPYVTYYCPHCSALNRRKQVHEHFSESNSPHMSTSSSVSDVEVTKNAASSTVEKKSATSSPLSPVDVAPRTAESNIVASDGPVS